jgi:hypothetical protein
VVYDYVHKLRDLDLSGDKFAKQKVEEFEDICKKHDVGGSLLFEKAVMAHSCNIGRFTMAQLTRDISYLQLKRVSDWQLTEEAQRGGLAELVGATEWDNVVLYGQYVLNRKLIKRRRAVA